MRFNLDDYKGRYVMLCQTVEEAESFCNFLQQNGEEWLSGVEYTKDNHWFNHKENTCYLFNEGLYSNLKYARQHNYIILKWKDFEESGNTMNNNNNDNDDKIIIKVQDYSENYETKLYKIPKGSYNLLKTLDNDFDLFDNDIRISILDIKEIEEF